LKIKRPQRRSHDLTAACFIAQLYSSATFISLRFQCRNEELGPHFGNISFFNFF
jgi:hypothetical protein